MKKFDHEKLDVYQVATQFLIEADNFCLSLPKGRNYIIEQIRRASLSICLNIAEGAGEYSSGEKKRFYRMARRSATECAALLDGARVLNLIIMEEFEPARTLLIRIVAMLVKLSKID